MAKRRQDVDRDAALRETGGGIARYFNRPAPIGVPRCDEDGTAAAQDGDKTAEEEVPSPADSSLPGPTQMWALSSPSHSLPSPAASAGSPAAASPASPSTLLAGLSRCVAAEVEVPAEASVVLPEVQAVQAELQGQLPAPSTLGTLLWPRSPASQASQASLPGPTQMWGAGIHEDHPCAGANFGLGAPRSGRHSISPTLPFHPPSPSRDRVPDAAGVRAPGECETPRPTRRSISPTLSFHPPSPECRVAEASNAASVGRAINSEADENARPLKKQRSLSPTLSFHMPSPQRVGIPRRPSLREPHTPPQQERQSSAT